MGTELKMRAGWKNAVFLPFFAAFLLAKPAFATGPAPVILVQPLSITVANLDIASLSVLASSLTTMTYQWYKNGSAIVGATNAAYSLVNVTTSDQGNYYV